MVHRTPVQFLAILPPFIIFAWSPPQFISVSADGESNYKNAMDHITSSLDSIWEVSKKSRDLYLEEVDSFGNISLKPAQIRYPRELDDEDVTGSRKTEKESSPSFHCPQKGSEGPIGDDRHHRHYPFCVGKNTLEEYKTNLPAYALLKDILTFKNSKLAHVPIFVTKNPSSGHQNVKMIEYSIMKFTQNSKVVVDMKLLPHPYTMGQWFHIKITTKKPVKVLLVQANVLPYAMPYGNFDIEFACSDCYEGDMKEQLGDSRNYEDQLAFKDRRAAVLPCFRRTHLHATHPDIYVFASNNPQSEFHFHYRFVDVTCRETKYIQFMIANQQVDGTLEAFYTAVIDHEHVHHSLDGTPLPMIHQNVSVSTTCHKTPILFRVPKNGNWYTAIYPEYEACLMESENSCAYQEKPPTYQSDYVCSGSQFSITRTLCPFDKTVEPGDCFGFSETSSMFNQCGKSGEVCGKCDRFENLWEDELFRRQIRGGYALKRYHGLLMILATIGLSNVSIHIARYFKETDGAVLLVGGWLWTHFGITLASILSMWWGIGYILQIPTRDHNVHAKFLAFQLSPQYTASRNMIINIHYVVGFATVVLFHIVFLFGALRPMSCRVCWIVRHAFAGYLTVLLGAISTWMSTACMETKVWTLILLAISIFPWIAACVLQVAQDKIEYSNRTYCPVIETINVELPIPNGPARRIILGLFILCSMVCLAIAAVKSDYTGLLIYPPCQNCAYKYDELILHEHENELSHSWLMVDKYKCTEEHFPEVFW